MVAKKKPGRPENLVPNSARTPEERRENARKAGQASAKARRERKVLSEMYAEFLAGEYEVEIGDKRKKISGEKLVAETIKAVLVRGDSAAVSMLKEIREGTEGNNLNLTGSLGVTIVDDL